MFSRIFPLLSVEFFLAENFSIKMFFIYLEKRFPRPDDEGSVVPPKVSTARKTSTKVSFKSHLVKF